MLSEEQMRMRQHGIGASEIAAVVGVSPHAGPLDVWMRKATPTRKPMVPEWKGNGRTEVGNRFEPVIRDLYIDQTGIQVVEAETLVHPKHPFILATPDGLSADGKSGLEIKMVGFEARSQWNEDGHDTVPRHYELQCRQNMAVTGRDTWDVAALFGTEFRVYTIERDMELEELMIQAAQEFWQTYIEGDTPPPPLTPGSQRQYLNALFPKNINKECAIPENASLFLRIAEELHRVKSEIRRLKDREEMATNALCEMTGENYGLIFGDTKFTWGWQNSQPSWKAIAEELAKGRINKKLIEKHTGSGTRATRLSIKK